MKQIPSPPFWGGVRVKKWSPFFDSGARSPIFGHLKMPKVPKVIFGHFIDFEYFGSNFSSFYIVKTPEIEMASQLSSMGL